MRLYPMNVAADDTDFLPLLQEREAQLQSWRQLAGSCASKEPAQRNRGARAPANSSKSHRFKVHGPAASISLPTLSPIRAANRASDSLRRQLEEQQLVDAYRRELEMQKAELEKEKASVLAHSAAMRTSTNADAAAPGADSCYIPQDAHCREQEQPSGSAVPSPTKTRRKPKKKKKKKKQKKKQPSSSGDTLADSSSTGSSGVEKPEVTLASVVYKLITQLKRSRQREIRNTSVLQIFNLIDRCIVNFTITPPPRPASR